MKSFPSTDFNLGFYVCGPPAKRRQLVLDWRSFFEAYADGECSEGESYLSAFCFDAGLSDYWHGAGGPKGYAGAAWAPHITVDVDSPVLADAMDAARALLAGMEYRHGVNLDAVACFFSGEKGFHILIPTPGLGAVPGVEFPSIAKRFIECLAGDAGGCVDFSVFDKQRIIRLPNSRHPRSGLFKVFLPADELLTLSSAAVRDYARERQYVGWRWAGPDWGAGGLPALWTSAARDVECSHGEQVRSTSSRCADTRQGTRLNRLTMQFILDGAPAGSRAVRLFSAAADIAGLGGNERIAMALLYEPALDCGLCPSEARRQILAGVEHGKRGSHE